jgi:hypothetical protein
METLTEKELIKMIPEPPADLVDWCKARDHFKDEFLIFQCGWNYEPLSDQNEKCLDVLCTACGGKFKADRLGDEEIQTECHSGYGGAPFYNKYNGIAGESVIKHGKKTKCPLCGAEVKCMHVSSFTYNMWFTAFPLIISRVGENLIAVSYRVIREIAKEGPKPYRMENYEAYIFTRRKNYRLAGWYSGGFGNICSTNKWELRKRCIDQYGECDRKMIYFTERNVFRGTIFENCKLSKYMQKAGSSFPVSYLIKFKRYPQIENLLVQGFGTLVAEAVKSRNAGTYSNYRAEAINWKEVSPRRMLGLSKPDFEALKSKKFCSKDILNFKSVREINASMKPEEILKLIEAFSWRLDELIAFGPKMEKMARYFTKQAKLSVRRNYNNQPGDAFVTWKDYTRMAKNLGYDLNDESLYMPPKLNAAHDRALTAQKYKQQKELIEKFQAMYEKLLPLSFEKDGLLIRPAASEEELIKEGKILNHCVGGYGETHCKGDSIFFIRRVEKPDMPYFTLQLSVKGKRILQNHGKDNIAPPPNVVKFQEFWLEHVVKADVMKSKHESKEVRAA